MPDDLERRGMSVRETGAVGVPAPGGLTLQQLGELYYYLHLTREREQVLTTATSD